MFFGAAPFDLELDETAAGEFGDAALKEPMSEEEDDIVHVLKAKRDDEAQLRSLGYIMHTPEFANVTNSRGELVTVPLIRDPDSEMIRELDVTDAHLLVLAIYLCGGTFGLWQDEDTRNVVWCPSYHVVEKYRELACEYKTQRNAIETFNIHNLLHDYLRHGIVAVRLRHGGFDVALNHQYKTLLWEPLRGTSTLAEVLQKVATISRKQPLGLMLSDLLGMCFIIKLHLLRQMLPPEAREQDAEKQPDKEM